MSCWHGEAAAKIVCGEAGVVTASGDGGPATPAAILRETPPPDDAGAQTADRYDWQAMMATADVLSLYRAALDETGNLVGDANFTVLCEHHEDWAVVDATNSEIVSAKHREASVGPFSTFRQVLADGGVLHLFNRWQALGRTPLCRLVTTSGLSGDGAKTATACQKLRIDPTTQDAEVVEVVTGLGQSIAALLAPSGTTTAPESAGGVRAFLAALRFQVAEARRDQLPDMAAERYGRPVAERLGQAAAGSPVWQAVLALVRPRMRAAGSSTRGALPTVLGVERDDPLAPRTLTLTDVDTAARFALNHVAGYAALPRMIKANRMAVKMAQGGCSDNAIERADDLRRQYRQHWRVRRSHPSVSDQQRRLINMLSRVIDEATYVVRIEGATCGPELWSELGNRFRTLEGRTDAQGLNADLLLGGVSELANDCRAWYTDRFDAPEVLRQLVAQGGAS